MNNPPATGRNFSVPAEAIRLLQVGGRALSQGQVAQAESLLDKAADLAPNFAEAHRLAGIAAVMNSNHAKAIKHLRVAVGLQPDDAMVHMTLGSVLIESGTTKEGLEHLERSCELAPTDAEAWRNYGVALRTAGHMQRALNAFQHAVTINPAFIKARNDLALAMLNLGNTQEAANMARETLKKQPESVDAWFVLNSLKTQPFDKEDIQQLQHLLHQASLSDIDRVPLTFTLAKALEDQSNYPAAFDVITKANTLKRRQVYWNRDEERTRVAAIAQAFEHPISELIDPEFGKEVIFIVSMPRSGSTLTEQILAAHPHVQGAGEIDTLFAVLESESGRRGQEFPYWVPSMTRADWHRLGKDYLDLTRELRGNFPYLTDKNTNNWAYVGAVMAMLPGARIVHSYRNPLETCFANYRQLFTATCDFSYDLDDIVEYYSGYEYLSQLWQKKFSHRIFDNRYEDLQLNTETQIRQLLDFCELPFDQSCIDFHQSKRAVQTISAAQVRQPIRKDTARSAHYGDKLDPLRAKLRSAGISA